MVRVRQQHPLEDKTSQGHSLRNRNLFLKIWVSQGDYFENNVQKRQTFEKNEYVRANLRVSVKSIITDKMTSQIAFLLHKKHPNRLPLRGNKEIIISETEVCHDIYLGNNALSGSLCRIYGFVRIICYEKWSRKDCYLS